MSNPGYEQPSHALERPFLARLTQRGGLLDELRAGAPEGSARRALLRLLALFQLAGRGRLPAPAAALLDALAAGPEQGDAEALRRIGQIVAGDRALRALALPGELLAPEPASHDGAAQAAVARALADAGAGALLGQAGPGALGDIYEALLAGTRRAAGAYYTPQHVVDTVVGLTIGRTLAERAPDADRALSLAICDPAMGCGSFLLGAADALAQAALAAPAAHPGGAAARVRRQVVTGCLYGVDLDPLAVTIARLCLCLTLPDDAPLPDLRAHLIAGDSLDASFGRAEGGESEGGEHPLRGWERALPEVFARGGFDAVIGNPPYIDSERMSRAAPDLRRRYARHWEAARGNWDLFVLFVELGVRLLKPGGRSGMIVPNRLLGAPYARAARDILRRGQLESIVDYSRAGVFDAGVYPVVYAVRAPAGDDARPELALTTVAAEGGGPPRVTRSLRVKPEALDALGDSWWPLLGDHTAPVLACVRVSEPLGALASVREAATVAEAYELAAHVEELDGTRQPGSYLRLVNSGTIARYGTHWGARRTRYLGRQFTRPIVAREALSRRARETAAPKLIIAGLSRRIEACYDASGELLAGKSTVLVLDARVGLGYLLALLNSRLLGLLYRELFGGLALRGGYLRVGAPQAASIPVRRIAFTTQPAAREALLAEALALYRAGDDAALLAFAGARLSAQPEEADVLHDLLDRLGLHMAALHAAGQAAEFARADALIDALVERLYGVTL